MEMLGRSGGNGGGGNKVVTFDDAVSSSGRRRNSSSLSSFLDMGRDAAADGGLPPRPPLPPAHGVMGSGGRRRTYGDGELDVFSAERYFRGAMDGDDAARKDEGAGAGVTLTQPLVETETETETARPPPAAVVMAKPSSTRASTVSFTAASSASAASSCANSQTALFRRRSSSSASRGDSNKCCVRVGVLMRTCSGKRSVRVDGGGAAAKEAGAFTAADESSAAAIDWYRELRMHKAVLGLSSDGNSRGSMVPAAAVLPPSLNLGTAKVAAIGGGREREEKVEAAAASAAELTFSTSSVRRRSNNFTTLVAPVIRAANVPASGGGAGKVGGGVHRQEEDDDDDDDDDAGSESSSDLFEIKSLMIDDCAYEPSEASIQWSVVTADASERGDRGGGRWVSGGGGRGPVAGRQQPRGHRPAGTGMLAGCASHRAVDVSAAAMMQRRSGEGFQKARRNGNGA